MYNDSNCKLKHDPITLSKEAINKAVQQRAAYLKLHDFINQVFASKVFSTG